MGPQVSEERVRRDGVQQAAGRVHPGRRPQVRRAQDHEFTAERQYAISLGGGNRLFSPGALSRLSRHHRARLSPLCPFPI